jgi:hypothetical protein
VFAHTHGPPAAKNAGGSHPRSRPDTRPSLRDSFNGLYVISPGTGFVAPVPRDAKASSRPRQRVFHALRGILAPEYQDHTTSPSAACRSSAGLIEHDPDRKTALQFSGSRSPTAAHRVHRIPHPTSVTIAIRPSGGTERAHDKSDASKSRSDLFSPTGLDRFLQSRGDLPVGQFVSC